MAASFDCASPAATNSGAYYGPAANAAQITGVVCGVRVETIADATTRKIRCMDKLIDELAKGRPMAKILRS
ncbi:MAG: DUF2200 family protein [Planctomycetes bacterium]|nr:DUF2200 family protein [Planctomycetota bacterium]